MSIETYILAGSYVLTYEDKGSDYLFTPSNFQSVACTDKVVALNWDEIANATGYNVYKNGVKVNVAPITTAFYVATGLTPETEYSFTVTSVNATKESAHSQEIWEYTSPAIPAIGDIPGVPFKETNKATMTGTTNYGHVYYVDLTKGQEVTFSVSSTRSAWFALALFKPGTATTLDMSGLAAHSFDQDVENKLSYTVEETGRYYLELSTWENAGTYTLTATGIDFGQSELSPYLIDGEYLYGLPSDKLSYQDFIKAITVPAGNQVKVLNKKGVEMTSGTIGTGCVVQYFKNGTLSSQYTVILYGDIDGDGTINVLDMVEVKKHCLKIKYLTGAALKAGNVDRDINGKVNAIDAVILKKDILNLAPIKQGE
ncbi:MAG: hypothetical protein BGN88_05465 [Clostridiales bacterium 43-6]|nr:MAG: hypothetical protein BGN88_05465 [Clostridiales bacterium 43-6]